MLEYLQLSIFTETFLLFSALYIVYTQYIRKIRDDGCQFNMTF